jgi:transposase-like protein
VWPRPRRTRWQHSTSSSKPEGVKYDKTVAFLPTDRNALLAFYDFAAEHRKHLRTTNVVESFLASTATTSCRNSSSV